MEKSFEISRRWDCGIYWRKDWKFIGFIEDCGFGRYIGITFKKKRWG